MIELGSFDTVLFNYVSICHHALHSEATHGYNYYNYCSGP